MPISHHHRHDRSLRLLFSHPKVIRDLILGFVDQSWVKDLDLDTLTSLPTDFVSGDLPGRYEERGGDVIWRARWKNREMFVVLLLELQSTSDSHMALRLLTYVSLLYQRLLREEALPVRRPLPPVVPLVFYNGERPWSAAREIQDLIAPVPETLAPYRPTLRYLLVDEGSRSREPLVEGDNVVAGIIRAERSATPQELEKAIDMLQRCTREPSSEAATLRRDLTAWLTKVVLPDRVQGTRVPSIEDLDEFKTYLESSMPTWTEQWEAQGVEKGMVIGRQEGRMEATKDLLRIQFEQRFGSGHREQLERWFKEADEEKVQGAIKRILTAESAEDLLQSRCLKTPDS